MPDYQKEIERIGEFLRKIIADRKAVIGISGGIDSSVTLGILSKFFLHENIKAVFMPDATTPKSDYDDVDVLASTFGVKYSTVNIQNIVDTFSKTLSAVDKGAIGNIKSRIRMIVLYYFANIYNGIVVGTTNRTELLLGYYTKYGDGGCDVEPIEHLYKRDIYEIARLLGVPESIIKKKPTAGLWQGQTDEDEIGMPYSKIDDILSSIFDKGELREDPDFKKILDLHSKSDHKRRLPYSLSPD
ncbi:NH(3) -depenent NAD + synthetase [Thermoplasma volcanium GSS1]|uniref:NH(3)-dependent NAD(+) synthetase n=1 Tax=Thermoplasma volcanium (strain ATCC 51530 / DSM 4299 / JCM 9571 / NBRC 15438 / GSS1) TaxID=273116 RepID=NADE_THEVO|nr:NAD+ synthase [Thermoplasma volcanium]Q979W4.1 RecName: Full=NH(3)-dependent NAD(+) synthetase [Thermoplasma volcanium GSS1]BAB60188.1 NH(3) -depenent NAD + synthetase [Thermoplasma volcanium GSS1]